MWVKQYISFFSLFTQAYDRFKVNNPLRMASSTAFFAIFALPPILIILINLLGSILSKEIVSGEFFGELRQSFGKEGTAQLETIFYNLQNREGHWLFTVGGIIFLFFVSTTLFVVLQGYINELWDVRQKKSDQKTQLVITLKQRIKSLFIILFSGLLVLSSFVTDILLYIIGNNLSRFVPEYDLSIFHIITHLFSIVVETVWFAVLFKYLPDVRIGWRAVLAGAVVTAVLFELGSIILRKLLVNSGITSVYGAAGSFVLLLLFIFYSSMILFYGASFTKTYALHIGTYVTPKSHAIEYEIKEL